MLQLKNLNKNYKVADYKVEALKNINLSFRKSEFVSVLGPSGSGKTTLLNIIGGLDKYDSGELIVNGRETKDFNEKEWNVYRNHRIGFVFQSYNLIPHQTVLSNVELALTIAGLSKEERTIKAKLALDKVGLSDQYYKKPNQLSGGQSQRVAIARALVNDPEILLADEPTGALDTVTSKQIMDLIEEISKDKLVIMVTHNPELAEKYSTRIINLLDGEVISDTKPYESKTKIVKDKEKQPERAKMSWWTTFKLSLQNLISKKNRTILTSVASSIGIIGISLVLSLSFGVQLFIKSTQEDMLSGNPIQVTTQALNLESMMQNMGPGEKLDIVKEIGKVGVDQVIKRLAERSSHTEDMLVENTITQKYIDYLLEMPKDDVAAIFLDRELDVNNNIYMSFTEEDGTETNLSVTGLKSIITSILKENEETKDYASLISNFTNIINEAPDNSEYILSQYDVVSGNMATEKDEIMLVLNKDGLISDLTLAQLGYYKQKEFENMVFKALENSEDDTIGFKDYFTYKEILGKEFRWHDNNSVFNLDLTYNAYEEQVVRNDNSLDLKVVGILEPKEGIEYGTLKNGFYYTKALSDYIIEKNQDSDLVKLFDTMERDQIPSHIDEEGNVKGISFEYSLTYLDKKIESVGLVGKTNPMLDMISGMGSQLGQDTSGVPTYYFLTKRDLGGEEIPSKISIYPVNLKTKDNVIDYLNNWKNTKAGKDNDIVYTDSLSIIFAMINQIIKMITIALVGFTSLALVVSSVMIAIITYISVVERIKEIGVIRSLGGSKRDVSNLFVAETAIIGLASGLIAIVFTYLASFIINIFVVKSIGANIAVFPLHYALIMLGVSMFLTLISGLIPSRSAAKKDPVTALRTE